MYIRKTVRKYKGKEYTNYPLVESVATPKGLRQRVVCSLGNLEPRSHEEWLLLARKVERTLSGQQALPLEEPDPLVEKIAAKARRAKAGGARRKAEEAVPVILEKVSVECARETGPVHVANQMWHRLGMEEILKAAGLTEKARLLTQVMVTNRLVSPSSEHAMPGWAGRTAIAGRAGGQRERGEGAYPSFAIVSSTFFTGEDRAIFERAIIPANAARVSALIEEILGAVFMGKRLLLCDRGRGN